MASCRSWLKIKIPCNIDIHFTKQNNPSVEDFDVQVIAQLKIFHVVNINLENATKYWQNTLCTPAPYRLNSMNELEENLKQNDKNTFYLTQDH